MTRRAQTIATRVITPEYLRERIIEQIGVVALGSLRDEKFDAAAALDAAGREDDELEQLDRDAAEEDERKEGPEIQ
ncbi:hypothetical protein [Sphingobium herbicidovorans]|uniref:hypothetical protein n=1 Tax=Sphingobium herbicidovorans TaxID=76947 RepID=UPI0012E0A2AE|nr:hypothetical protein [Sphingobium herbicidovorans]